MRFTHNRSRAEILQQPNSRCWDNSSFENEAYWEPRNIQKSIGTPGLYLQAQDSTGCDSGVVTSSNTSGINFFTQNNHTIGLTGPLNVASGSWRWRLPHTLVNTGQVMYEAPVDGQSDYPLEFTVSGSSGNLLAFNGSGAPFWTTNLPANSTNYIQNSSVPQSATAYISSETVSTLIIPGIVSQNCVGTDATGKLQTGTCSGGGGGSSALQVTQNGVQNQTSSRQPLGTSPATISTWRLCWIYCDD